MRTYYRELAPALRLASAVECFWTIRTNQAKRLHRVLPDGCADILFSLDGGDAALEAIGCMTQYQDCLLPANGLLVGVRFRPGMSRCYLRTPGNLITDGRIPLNDFWGATANRLRDRLAEAVSLEACAALFEEHLAMQQAFGPAQRAIAWIAQRQGFVSIDEAASRAGLSVRQFRRDCLREAGLSPKLLARVLRFRHALSRLNCNSAGAQLALECGYYDQAHLINEFRRFSGNTPAAHAALR